MDIPQAATGSPFFIQRPQKEIRVIIPSVPDKVASFYIFSFSYSFPVWRSETLPADGLVGFTWAAWYVAAYTPVPPACHEGPPGMPGRSIGLHASVRRIKY